MQVPLWLIRKDLGIALEKGLPHVLGRAVALRQILIFCGYYRRMGIVELFLSGLPAGLFENLAKSARAFLFYLDRAEEDTQVASQSEPFFDAVACGDLDAARAIAERSRSRWNEGEEYEEDFLHVRFLMDHGVLRREQPHLDGLLERFEQVLDGGDDPRLALCRALLRKEQKRWDETLERMVDDHRRETEEALRGGEVSPNDAATVCHLWVELLALLRFAEQAGLRVARNHPFAPSVARRLELAHLPPPDAWRDVPSYFEFE
jgi:hypothetical protein